MATVEQKATLPDWLANLPPIEPGMGYEVESHVALGAGDRLPFSVATHSPGIEREKVRRVVVEGHHVSRRRGRWWITLRIYHRVSREHIQFRGEPEMVDSRVGTVDELVAWLAQYGVEVERRKQDARPYIARA